MERKAIKPGALKNNARPQYHQTQSARAVEYTDSISAEG